jgi:hypothetical protein
MDKDTRHDVLLLLEAISQARFLFDAQCLAAVAIQRLQQPVPNADNGKEDGTPFC